MLKFCFHGFMDTIFQTDIPFQNYRIYPMYPDTGYNCGRTVVFFYSCPRTFYLMQVKHPAKRTGRKKITIIKERK